MWPGRARSAGRVFASIAASTVATGLAVIIGVLVSMFSAIAVTRVMLRYVTRTSWGRRLELYHVER